MWSPHNQTTGMLYRPTQIEVPHMQRNLGNVFCRFHGIIYSQVPFIKPAHEQALLAATDQLQSCSHVNALQFGLELLVLAVSV